MTARDEWDRLRGLLRQRSVYEGERFALASGRTSSFYIDGKLTTLTPEGAYLTARLILARLRDAPADAIGGPTLGADPIVCSVVALSQVEGQPLPGFIVRKEPKGHGRQRLIEGPFQEGWRVVLVEDVITTGGSVLKAVRAVEEAGGTVTRIITLVDRQQGAAETLAQYNYDPLFTTADLGLHEAG